MKKIRSIIICLLVASFITGFASIAYADNTSNYRVRVYGGRLQQGTVYDKSVPAGTSLLLSNDIGVGSKVVDDKSGKSYYVKSALRESGREIDAKEEEERLTKGFQVTKDQDFVLVYEVIRNEVKYYVDYLDTNGNSLRARSGPFFANEGDVVYVAYVEIAGYTPDALSHTNTDGITNGYVFTFKYTRNTTTTTTTTTTGGGGAAAAAAANAAANANNQNNANNANNQNNANNPNNPNNPQGANNPAGNNTNIPTQPYDVIDEAEIPLADFPGGVNANNGVTPSAPKVIEPNTHNRLPSWALVASSVALVGLIAMLYWYLLFYRKKKKYATAGGDIDFGDYEEDDDF